MLRFTRPARAKGVDDPASKFGAARIKIAGDLAAGGVLDDEHFPAHWKAHKSDFARTQHNKCGFCEAKIVANQPGDVEHHAPKAAVAELDVASRGVEVENGSSSVADRRHARIIASGYHGLAYEWDNWLLACERCNRGWKRNFYPVLESPRAWPPRATAVETALLLHPFQGPDPAEHLRFDDTGQVDACDGSPFGRATIDTCGLDRETLRDARREKARRAWQLVGRVVDRIRRDRWDDLLDDLDDLLDAGSEAHAHAGRVRSIVQEGLDLTWVEFASLRARIAAWCGAPAP